MGEHATYRGQWIKIGTCEEMYYLRADQRHLISGYSFDRNDRFRFPFPDEDTIEPGEFADHNRGVRIPEFSLADCKEHGSVQFTSRAGYVLSIPCPEQFGEPGMTVNVLIGEETLRVGRNGFNGHPVVESQVAVGDELWTIVRCNACGSKWRLDAGDAAPVIAAFRAEAVREEYRHDLKAWGPAHEGKSRRFHEEIANRIEAGYQTTPVAA